ncbi:hypothetical protein HYH03_009817 [Edaphochlamys debaryana]|uniref:tripeptidyl-peptidase II n=1 Tax=Edaphochlamys debaryana TaxID=47281 RepID=A0A836BY30_9CHLO|nr:hypothetical protein HYH03_009817 [Edaphochlamys debaryana]|eukprot:KAG2491863.1 hypothetical protein HYH03_009817 [Edaphochlamys debaryana]
MPIQDYPEYDGRGIKIAVFDTGVDPGAAGLQVTTDGKPKIIDILDCSGSGDVDTSRVEKADAEGCIAGASGRRLRPNPAWKNPSGEWHVGCKHVYGLVSRGLVTRLKEDRKKRWEEAQRRAVAEAVAALAKFDRDTPGSKLSEPEAKKERAELEGRVGLLKDLAKAYEDPGPLLDCVVWHDGGVWRAALDTAELHPPGSGKGLLADFQPLANYAIERQYGTFSELDSCNFVLNTLEEGRLLSIVVDCGAHGTHVAGITAAHFPEDPGSNGIAPGAQIISCKIGDTRLGSMETGVGVVRGLIAARQHGAHLINMSYGEPTTTPNAGRFIELATELVRKHDVIFVASAGNAGPALSTVGAPGGTSSALFGVGAYVSPQLAAAGHSVLEAPPVGLQYTWSSRGPTSDGHVGVAFSAPGGAIAPVPQWTQQRRQLMNGTSMSSPNACGGIALLLSGLHARGSPLPPHRLRRALENTALPLGGGAPDAVLTYGRGLIQIDEAWGYLLRDLASSQAALASAPAAPAPPPTTPTPTPSTPTPTPTPSTPLPPGPWYEVEAACAEGRGPRGRGVYLREPHETSKTQSFRVSVTPKLREDAANSARLGVEDRLVLEASAPWLACPPALMLHHAGRSFEVLVDPTALPPGLHYGEVAAYEVDARGKGPLFRVPVTVIKPLQVPQAGTPAGSPAASPAASADPPTDGSETDAPPGSVLAPPSTPASGGGGGVGALALGPLSFSPGSEHRSFVAVPPGATWAELTLRASSYDTPKLFLIRGTQLAPETAYRQHELRTQVALSGGSEYHTSMEVRGGSTLELTLAQFWSSPGVSRLEQVELSFHGVSARAEGRSGARPGADLALDGAELAKKVLVSTPPWARATRVKPEARLTSLRIPLRPAESALEPLTAERDALTEGRVAYRLLLTYRTTLAEAGKYKPCLPLVNKLIYDSPLESQLLLVHDGATKQLMGTQDASPEAVSLKKGDLLLRLALRSDSQELLDKMRNMPLVLKRNLDGSGVSVPVYGTRREAIMAAGGLGSPAGEMLLRAGDEAPLWLGPVPEDKLPKDATAGRLLTGTLSLGQLRRGGGAAPAKHAISYLVPPAATPAASAGGGNGKDEAADKGPQERLAEALRDAQVKLLKDLKLSDAAQAAMYDKIVSDLRTAHPAHLPLLTEHLKKMDGREAAVRNTPAGRAAVVAAAEAVVGAVDAGALAAFLGVKAGEDTPEYRKTKKDMDERKAALIDALSKKAAVLLEVEEAEARGLEGAIKAAAEKEKGEKEGEEKGGEGEEVREAVRAVESAVRAVRAAAKSAEEAEEAEVVAAEEEGEVVVAAEEAAHEQGAATAAPAAGTAAAGDSAAGKTAGGVAAAAAGSGSGSGPDQIVATMQELRKWVDTASEPPHLLLHARTEARAKRYTSALKALDKLTSSDDKAAASAAGRREVSDLRAKLYAALGWAHWEAQEKELQAVRFPKDLLLM